MYYYYVLLKMVSFSVDQFIYQFSHASKMLLFYNLILHEIC